MKRERYSLMTPHAASSSPLQPQSLFLSKNSQGLSQKSTPLYEVREPFLQHAIAKDLQNFKIRLGFHSYLLNILNLTNPLSLRLLLFSLQSPTTFIRTLSIVVSVDFKFGFVSVSSSLQITTSFSPAIFLLLLLFEFQLNLMVCLWLRFEIVWESFDAD